MKIQSGFMLLCLFFSSVFLGGFPEINDDTFDVRNNRFRDNDVQTIFTAAAYEKLNENRDDYRAETYLMAASEKLDEYRDRNDNSRDNSSQEPQQNDSHERDSSGSRHDPNERDRPSDHERSMAAESRHERREKNFDQSAHYGNQKGVSGASQRSNNRYYDLFTFINHSKTFIEELTNNGQTKRCFTDKVLTLTHEANLMLSDRARFRRVF